MWNHPGHEQLVYFQIFVAPKDGAYNMKLPHALIPAFQGLVLKYDCGKLILPGPGIYKAIATASYIIDQGTYKLSDPSNEIVFQVGDDLTPLPVLSSPTSPLPPIVSLPSNPPPLSVPQPTAWVPLPTPSGSGWASESCKYLGTC